MLKYLRSSSYPPEDPFQLIYKSDKSTLDTFASLIQHICNHFGTLMKYVRFAFPGYLLAFHALPKSPPQNLEASVCSRPFLMAQ